MPKPAHPDKLRVSVLVRQLLDRSDLSVNGVTARMERYLQGGEFSENMFENHFTTRLDRPLKAKANVIHALILALTEGLRANERCQAVEAAELIWLFRWPDLFSNVSSLFPFDELLVAYQRFPQLFINLPITPLLHASTLTPLQCPPLPHPRTALLGRTSEVALLLDHVQRHQLLTITGPAGCGKTRLALQIAAQSSAFFPAGVAFIALADLHTPDLLFDTIGTTLGLKVGGEQSWMACLTNHLAAHKVLLVVDNFEHLLPVAPQLLGVLDSCPHLHLLVTSRVALGLSGEHVFHVHPLVTPPLNPLPACEMLPDYPAIQLFCERAHAVRPDFVLTPANCRDVAHICAILIGMPLAIELAAARIRHLSPQELRLQLIGNSTLHEQVALDLLSHGARDAHPRQQTLTATLTWSYRLLEAPVQRLLARMAVFSGGCTFDELHQLMLNVDQDAAHGAHLRHHLETLLNHHLLTARSEEQIPTRYRMRATVREYAWQQLITLNEHDLIAQIHATVYVDLVANANRYLHGDQQSFWHQRIEQELANVRVALEWMLQHGQLEQSLHLCANLELFWYWGGHLEEGGNWLRRILAQREELAARTLAKALDELAGLQWARGFLRDAEALAQESLAIWRSLDDAQGIVEALNSLGLVAEAMGDFSRAAHWHRESLALRRHIGKKPAIVIALNNLGDVEYAADPVNYDQALNRFRESLAINQELNNQHGIADTLSSMGSLALLQGDYAQAQTYLSQSLSLFQQLGNSLRMAYAFESLADVALANVQYERALRLCAAASALRTTKGMHPPPMAIPSIAQRIINLGTYLEQNTFALAWAEGIQMDLKAAIGYALAVPSAAPLKSFAGCDILTRTP
ncbi:ATP-binding protein [Candidatus Oscillochloris fontis]|uniref:ATP-binding protein n=1 Tax=Candidatus Oscillochloris fontis TaxID=2496868 RepID=UPI00101BD17E|nr:tetratricopeptide repeat protein [Candidatus Oscillochloris fontis]